MGVLEKIRLNAEQEAILNDGGIVRIPAGWEEFLEFEKESDYPAEFHYGQIVLSSQETFTHEWFVAHVAYLLGMVFVESDFSILGSNLRLVPTNCTGLYNADLSILRGKPVFFEDDDSMLMNPYLLVEIFPESARQMEFCEKLFEYQKMPSLRILMVIDPKTDSVIVHTRTERPKTWLTTLYDQPDEIILLNGRTLALAEVFRGKPTLKTS
ncbi:MAG: Uma2 family endonuclease [Cytophagaceae bacterium]|nr:Uma2 family endonuclease [Cytophagaceae bacterium]